jgi:diguanylate cyclase (GGDEF)-like protein
VVAYLLHPFPPEVGGGLLFVHRAGEPRGFTSLCERLAEQVAGAAAALVQVAQARDVLEGQLLHIRTKLASDSLTAVASRHRWDEELERAQALVDAGLPVTVALVDLDELKVVNDTRGHAAGDELLRVCAEALAAGLRGGTDLVARLGGDEFAVLVPSAGDAEGLAGRLRAALDGVTTHDGIAVRASVGAAASRAGERLSDTVRRADAAMYAEKRRRRR